MPNVKAAFASICFAGTLWLASAQAADLPASRPEAQGMSWERLARISAMLKADVAANKIPGAVLLVARHGKVVHCDAVGKVGPSTDAPMTRDAIFRIYSMSKPVTTVAAMMLDQFEKQRLLDPLGMADTSFYVTDAANHARVAEPLADDRNFGLHADFGNPRVAGKWESGGGGMVSTAMDYARFAQMLLAGGTLDGKRYLSPKTLAFMTSDHLGTAIATTPLYLPGPGTGFGLGFAVRRAAGEAAYPAAVGSYFWGGAGGTYFSVDPKNDLFVVLMMQSPKLRVCYRTVLHDMVYAAFVE
ncbi:MAG: beta-lactamase family protein [Bacteriovorax sp.]|nr:beta-lactamase family protein [Rhizobacter sp.]